jgi:hypothetical protein
VPQASLKNISPWWRSASIQVATVVNQPPRRSAALTAPGGFGIEFTDDWSSLRERLPFLPVSAHRP